MGDQGLQKNNQLEIVFYDPYQMGSIAIELECSGSGCVNSRKRTKRIEADQGLYDAIPWSAGSALQSSGIEPAYIQCHCD